MPSEDARYPQRYPDEYYDAAAEREPTLLEAIAGAVRDLAKFILIAFASFCLVYVGGLAAVIFLAASSQR